MQEKIRGHLVQRIGGGAGDRSQRAAGEFAWHQATYVRCRDGLSILGQEDFVPKAPYTHLLSPGMIGAMRLRNRIIDRKSVVWGKSVSVRVDLGGRRILKKKKK